MFWSEQSLLVDSVTGCHHLFNSLRCHIFRIKCVSGMEVQVKKDGFKDENDLLCSVSRVFLESTVNVKMESKWSEKSDLMKKSAGQAPWPG